MYVATCKYSLVDAIAKRRLYTYIHTYIHTFIGTLRHANIHWLMQKYQNVDCIHTYIHTFIGTLRHANIPVADAISQSAQQPASAYV